MAPTAAKWLLWRLYRRLWPSPVAERLCPESSVGGTLAGRDDGLLTVSGTHTLKWTYTRGSEYDDGQGYVDGLAWTGTMPVLPEPDPDAWHILLYRYDAADRRVEKQYNYETITMYVYDGDQCPT